MKRAIIFSVLTFSLFLSMGSAFADHLPGSISMENLRSEEVSGSIEAEYGQQYFLPPLSSGKYVEVDFTLVNNGDSPFNVSYSDFFLQSGKKKFFPSKLSIYFKNSIFMSTINPGMKKKSSILFAIPDNVKDLDIRYTSDPTP